MTAYFGQIIDAAQEDLEDEIEFDVPALEAVRRGIARRDAKLAAVVEARTKWEAEAKIARGYLVEQEAAMLEANREEAAALRYAGARPGVSLAAAVKALAEDRDRAHEAFKACAEAAGVVYEDGSPYDVKTVCAAIEVGCAKECPVCIDLTEAEHERAELLNRWRDAAERGRSGPWPSEAETVRDALDAILAGKEPTAPSWDPPHVEGCECETCSPEAE